MGKRAFLVGEGESIAFAQFSGYISSRSPYPHYHTLRITLTRARVGGRERHVVRLLFPLYTEPLALMKNGNPDPALCLWGRLHKIFPITSGCLLRRN